MIILKKPLKSIELIIGGQAIEPKANYRLFTYCLDVEVEGGVLLANLFTRSVVFLTKKEFDVLRSGVFAENLDDTSKELVVSWFLVPEEFDDYKFCNETRDFISMLDQKDGKYSHYVVMSTSDCNARCFYCYQMGRNKARTHMSNETAKEVARFIKDTASNKISIQWYGGEPLYNDSVIDIICNFLRENGIVYTSSMITNGYLLDKPVIEKAKDLWNVERVQVAIDGTEETYNRCKAYIYKDDVSPYRRVISNIKEALDADIKVSVRVNMDNHNVKEMYELVDELWHYFGEYEGFSVYAAGLYENVGPNNPVRTAQSRMELTDNLIAFEEYCSQKGLKIHRKFSDKLTLNRCMADNRKSVTISQDGLLGKCDHLMETDTFGSVFSDRVDTSILASFRERLNTREMCGKCPVYPECIRLRKCKDDGGGCDAAYQKLKIYKTRRRIENVLKNKNKAE